MPRIADDQHPRRVQRCKPFLRRGRWLSESGDTGDGTCDAFRRPDEAEDRQMFTAASRRAVHQERHGALPKKRLRAAARTDFQSRRGIARHLGPAQ